MVFEALLAAVAIALLSLVGVFFFGHDKRLIGAERYVIPIAVGVFLSLVLNELIPETLAAGGHWGGVVVLLGFLGFYVLSQKLHQRYHHLEADDCDRKGAASLLLIGDAVHNFTDGVVLAGAFLVDPVAGVATAVGLAMHEVPQEIVEFGVLLRAGFTRKEAALRNLLSASTIILGAVVTLTLAAGFVGYVWILIGIAAGNLLFLAASDLLPRIHGNLPHYGSVWRSAVSILLGFIVMFMILEWSHEHMGDEHLHDADHHQELHEGE